METVTHHPTADSPLPGVRAASGPAASDAVAAPSPLQHGTAERCGACGARPSLGLEIDLLDAREECRRLKRAGADMHAEMLALHRALSAARQQTQALLADRRERGELQSRVDALLQSRSWRITRPLRWIYGLLPGRG